MYRIYKFLENFIEDYCYTKWMRWCGNCKAVGLSARGIEDYILDGDNLLSRIYDFIQNKLSWDYIRR